MKATANLKELQIVLTITDYHDIIGLSTVKLILWGVIKMTALIDCGRNGYDDVQGVVIGDILVTWQLFYDGRPQGGKETANTESEALADAKIKCDQLKAEWKGYPTYLYQDDNKWECRTW